MIASRTSPILPTNFVYSRNLILSRGHYEQLSRLSSHPMIDCCNAQLQTPKRDMLLSFEHKRDRTYCIHNKKGTCNVETTSRKLLVFTLYVNPYMLNGVSHFNLLDELIT